MTEADEAFCHLTTRGRVPGGSHDIEIWFATDDGRTISLMAGGCERADWGESALPVAIDLESPIRI